MINEQLLNGLVLAQRGTRLSLLSLEEGRVEKVWFAPKFQVPLHTGSFISYQVSEKKGSFPESIEQVDLDFSVLSLPHCDIYLLHALIELCLYSIPVGGEAQKVFYVMERMLRGTSLLSLESVEMLYKKQILCTLLALIGLYPDNEEIHALVTRVMNSPIDNLLQGAIHLNSEELMNQWLHWSLQVHPHKTVFKALPFFIEK